MARDYSRSLPSVKTDSNITLGNKEMGGVYYSRPSATPKYKSNEGRDTFNDLTVARIYITGDTNFDTLPGPARNFSFGSYVGFLLQEVTERNSEKAQISPLNGDGYAAYFSGREPPVYSFSGILLNTRQDQWRATFTHLYDNLLRGSKITGLNRLVQISYDDKVITGSMMNLNQVVSASPDETFTRFTFDILVASVYDSWMHTDSNFDDAWDAFIGDTSIFPNIPNESKKKTSRSFQNGAYGVIPPRVQKRGKGKKKLVGCDAANITTGLSGQAVSQTLPALPDSCYTQETLTKVNDELSSVEKKIAEEGAKPPDKKNQQKIDSLEKEKNRLVTTGQTLQIEINSRAEKAKKAADFLAAPVIPGAEPVLLP
jgi:hypothetical protein